MDCQGPENGCLHAELRHIILDEFKPSFELNATAFGEPKVEEDLALHHNHRRLERQHHAAPVCALDGENSGRQHFARPAAPVKDGAQFLLRRLLVRVDPEAGHPFDQPLERRGRLRALRCALGGEVEIVHLCWLGETAEHTGGRTLLWVGPVPT